MINTPFVSDASKTQDFTLGDFDRLPPDRPSKTKRKNNLARFREFTTELVELSQGRFHQLDLPEDIKQAVAEARKLTSMGAKRRQMSFVARLVEDLDIEALRETIRSMDHGRPPKSAAPVPPEPVSVTGTDVLAEQLLDGDDQAVFALADRFGPSERQMLRLFLRKIKKNLARGDCRKGLVKAITQYLSTLAPLGDQDSF